MHGEREVVQHLAAAASAGEVRGGWIVVIERHAQVLHGKQMVPAGMMRGARMAVMVVQLAGLVGHGVAIRLQSVHKPPLSLRRTCRREGARQRAQACEREDDNE